MEYDLQAGFNSLSGIGVFLTRPSEWIEEAGGDEFQFPFGNWSVSDLAEVSDADNAKIGLCVSIPFRELECF